MPVEGGGQSLRCEGDSYESKKAEMLLTPETRAETVEEIAVLLYRIIEIGPGLDPDTVRQWRSQLRASLARLEIDLEDGHWGFLYLEQVGQTTKDRQFPDKPRDYPDFEVFRHNSQRLKSDLRHKDEFVGVSARHGTLEEYLYGLGIIMSSQLSYKYIFPKNDPIRINAKTGEVEGRHRYLTLLILDECDYPVRRWSDWVVVEQI